MGNRWPAIYDGEVGELVVPMREDGFTVVQRATLVHELTHALTDQHFDFHVAFDAMVEEERLDEAAAYQALIEGDASLTELHFLQTLTQAELGEFFAEALDIDTTRSRRRSCVHPGLVDLPVRLWSGLHPAALRR